MHPGLRGPASTVVSATRGTADLVADLLLDIGLSVRASSCCSRSSCVNGVCWMDLADPGAPPWIVLFIGLAMAIQW